MDNSILELDNIISEFNIDMFINEYNNFSDIMNKHIHGEIINEGINWDKIKEKIKTAIGEIIKRIRDLFKKIVGKIKEVFSTPIHESIHDTVKNQFKNSLKDIDKKEEKYIGRVIVNDSKAIEQLLSLMIKTNDKCGEDLEKLYNDFLHSSKNDNKNYTSLEFEDYYHESIMGLIKDVEDFYINKKSKYGEIVTTKNIKNHANKILSVVYDDSIIFNYIKKMEKDCDNYLSKMKNVADGLYNDKIEDINNEAYSSFTKSCNVYARVVSSSATLATKIYLNCRKQYVRCIINTIIISKRQ